MKKKLLVVGVILLAIFVLLNVSWFAWRSTYNKYTGNMEKEVYSSSVFFDYHWEDEDGYRYYASYPSYISFGGSLSVCFPTGSTQGVLTIHPSVSGKYDYLYVFSTENNDHLLMYIDAQGNSSSDEYNELVERYKDDIDILLKKANDMWKLGG